MTLLKKRSSRGFTLVELMIVVAIIGILAALAIVGVKKYMTSAKSAEARNSLGTMSGLASQVWSGEKMDRRHPRTTARPSAPLTIVRVR